MVLYLCMLCGCQNNAVKNGHVPDNKIDSQKVQSGKLNQWTVLVNSDTMVQRIRFGVFCHLCTKHCATMFQYNMVGNANTLLADYTDSYLKKPEMEFNTPIHNDKKMKIAEGIVQHIPHRYVADTSRYAKFGCPDCLDQCGIYFEIQRERSISRYLMDYYGEDNNPDLNAFVKYLLVAIEKLKQP